MQNASKTKQIFDLKAYTASSALKKETNLSATENKDSTTNLYILTSGKKSRAISAYAPEPKFIETKKTVNVQAQEMAKRALSALEPTHKPATVLPFKFLSAQVRPKSINQNRYEGVLRIKRSLCLKNYSPALCRARVSQQFKDLNFQPPERRSSAYPIIRPELLSLIRADGSTVQVLKEKIPKYFSLMILEVRMTEDKSLSPFFRLEGEEYLTKKVDFSDTRRTSKITETLPEQVSADTLDITNPELAKYFFFAETYFRKRRWQKALYYFKMLAVKYEDLHTFVTSLIFNRLTICMAKINNEVSALNFCLKPDENENLTALFVKRYNAVILSRHIGIAKEERKAISNLLTLVEIEDNDDFKFFSNMQSIISSLNLAQVNEKVLNDFRDLKKRLQTGPYLDDVKITNEVLKAAGF